MVKKEFELPDLGEGIAEADLIGWLVEAGEAVEEDQPIAEVETDKALAQVPSPYDGTVAELRADEGEMIEVGDVFVVFEVDGTEEPSPDPDATEPTSAEESADTPVETDGRIFSPPRVRRLAREHGVDLASLQERLDGDRITEEDVIAAAEGEEPEPAAPDPSAGAGPTTVAASQSAERERTLAVPATRRVAREHGVDINEVPATEERDGEAFVTAEDVAAFAAGESAGQPAPQSPSPEATEEPAGPQPGDRLPYRGVRRTIGEQMAAAKFTAPHAGHHDQVEVSTLVEIRNELKEEAAAVGVNLTYLPFAVKATVAALKTIPEMNAALDEEAEEIVFHDEYHVGIAVATDAGLMVPVIDHADRKGLLELAREINDKAQRARDRTIDLEELQGGTFTITNIGPLGGEYASPIVNHPEVGILALGEVRERPWVEDSEVVARPTLPLSVAIDHRVVDGAEAARFTNEVKRYLHKPHRLLLE